MPNNNLREAEILRASEREQIRISQDLHDGYWASSLLASPV